MIIKIDYRERDLIELCQNLIVSPKVSSKLTILTENLHVGDIVITDTDKQGEELLIIERKSLNDLAASIKDGRYSEQSFRLNQYPTHNHHIVYLIEEISLRGNNMDMVDELLQKIRCIPR